MRLHFIVHTTWRYALVPTFKCQIFMTHTNCKQNIVQIHFSKRLHKFINRNFDTRYDGSPRYRYIWLAVFETSFNDSFAQISGLHSVCFI